MDGALIAALVTAVGTMLLGIVGLIAYQAGRISALQSSYYSKRMEVFDEIIEATIAYYEEIVPMIRHSNFSSQNDIRAIIYKTDSYKDLYLLTRKRIVYLPKDVTEAIIAFEFSFVRLKKEHRRVLRDSKLYDEYQLVEPHDELGPSEAYRNLILTIRKHIGTDTISEKTLNVFSKSPEQWQDED